MTVYFIGAGPGAPDLITLRAKTLIERCDLILYAGSLIPEAVIAGAKPSANKINTASLSRPDIFALFIQANTNNQDIARLHSGDVSLYSAMAEQIAYLREKNMAYEIVPGVPSFAAAAACFGIELTQPGECQTVILTRSASKASSQPEAEKLSELAKSGATLAIHLSAKNASQIAKELMPHYGRECPVFVAVEVSWPTEKCVKTTLENLSATIKQHKIERTAIILVGKTLNNLSGAESALYDENYQRHLKT